MHGAYVGLIVGVPLTGETVCLMAVAIQKDSHMVAAFTIIGLAAAVSSALDGPLSRLRHPRGQSDGSGYYAPVKRGSLAKGRLTHVDECASIQLGLSHLGTGVGPGPRPDNAGPRHSTLSVT